GAFVAVSCGGILGFARSASTDMVLAAPFALAMMAWWVWRSERQERWLLASYLWLAIATLSKGPVAVLLAAIVVLIFVAAEQEWRLLLKSLSFPGMLTFVLIALPWYVLVQVRDPQFFEEFIVRQNLARFGSNLYRHPHPFWYYVPVLLLGLFPWTVFAFAGL